MAKQKLAQSKTCAWCKRTLPIHGFALLDSEWCLDCTGPIQYWSGFDWWLYTNNGDIEKAEPKARHSKTRSSFVYFFQRECDALVKIGVSVRPKKRMKDVEATINLYRCLDGLPKTSLKLLGVFDGGYELESELHDAFAEHCVTGEWFTPAPVIMAFVGADE